MERDERGRFVKKGKTENDLNSTNKRVSNSKLFVEKYTTINGEKVTRIKSGVFYLAGFSSLIIGIVFINNTYNTDSNVAIAFFLILTLPPILFLYPLIRFVFGGKDSLFAIIVTTIVTFILRYFLFKKIDDDY